MSNEIIMKKRILHVDDEEDTLEIVKIILEKAGYEVVNAKNGSHALKQIDLDGFDLLIFDIMMPDMSGWDLFTRVSNIKPNYKIIFLSVLELSNERKKELIEMGVLDYIQKPFDRNDLVRRVSKAIEGN